MIDGDTGWCWYWLMPMLIDTDFVLFWLFWKVTSRLPGWAWGRLKRCGWSPWSLCGKTWRTPKTLRTGTKSIWKESFVKFNIKSEYKRTQLGALPVQWDYFPFSPFSTGPPDNSDCDCDCDDKNFLIGNFVKN